jgi:hypothetical protein
MRNKKKTLVILTLISMIAISQCSKIGIADNSVERTLLNHQSEMTEGKRVLLKKENKYFVMMHLGMRISGVFCILTKQ